MTDRACAHIAAIKTCEPLSGVRSHALLRRLLVVLRRGGLTMFVGSALLALLPNLARVSSDRPIVYGTRRRTNMVGFVAAILLLLAVTAVSALSQADDDAAALPPFLSGVAQYLALHHRVEASIAPVSLPADAMNLYVVPTALRDQLRRARAGTQEGKIFTPRAAALFKRLIAQTAKGHYAALLRATHEDCDKLGRALVNERWPGTALTTMPPDLLAVLPRLPPELEYRFVHRDLVLWDVQADLIVDVLRDGIPLEGRGRTK